MTTRERFRAVCRFQPFDRLPVVEWAPWWDRTLERWRGEGLPTSLTDRYEVARHFGLDVFRQLRLPSARARAPRPPRHGAGIVSSMDDYERVRKHLFPPPGETDDLASWAAEDRRGEDVLWYTMDGFFWFPRTLLGIERHLYAFYDQPELMHRMNSDLADHHLRALEEISGRTRFDFMSFAEDMSYNHGPMISRELFDEFVAPYYRRIIPALEERGILPFVDSDGDVGELVPWLESVGVRGVFPLERRAGVDVELLRSRHPRIIMMGAFDKTVMSRGEEAVRAEFERLLPVARGGGFVVSCDHQTPPEVSRDDYRLYVRLFREYAELAGSRPASVG